MILHRCEIWNRAPPVRGMAFFGVAAHLFATIRRRGGNPHKPARIQYMEGKVVRAPRRFAKPVAQKCVWFESNAFRQVEKHLPLWYSWCVRRAENAEDTVRFRGAAPMRLIDLY